MGILNLRKTRKYVGTYKHLDDWETIGTYQVEASQAIEPEETNDDWEDPCEPTKTVRFVKVKSDSSTEDIKQALKDIFTIQGCGHEFDCCGCRSWQAREVEYLGKEYWRLIVTSYRNY